jgi:hypothetical protein
MCIGCVCAYRRRRDQLLDAGVDERLGRVCTVRRSCLSPVEQGASTQLSVCVGRAPMRLLVLSRHVPSRVLFCVVVLGGTVQGVGR